MHIKLVTLLIIGISLVLMLGVRGIAVHIAYALHVQTDEVCSQKQKYSNGSILVKCCWLSYDKDEKTGVITNLQTWCDDCLERDGQDIACSGAYQGRIGVNLPILNSTSTFTPPIPNRTSVIINQLNSTNSTTQPSSGLLNGKIPTTNTFNAPITTSNGNTSNPNNGTTTAMKSTRGVYSPTGGCIPGGSTCVPCDIGLARIGANCIPSGDWHPSNSLPPLSTLQQQQQQPPITPPPTTTLPPSSSTLQQQQQQPTTTTCPDGSQPDANGNCPSTSTTTSPPPSPLTSATKNQQSSHNANEGTNPIKHCSKTNAGGPHCSKAG